MDKSLFFLIILSIFILINITLGQNISPAVKTFTLVNDCKETIWPGIITKGDHNYGDGFTLKPSQTTFYTAQIGWSGRIWGRTRCAFNRNNTGTCQTGDCGATLNCTVPSHPPNTIAEFTIGEVDFYDVSLVDGFNLPIVISPVNGKGNCSVAGCDGDLKQSCPSELVAKSSAGDVIACRSACDVFNTDEYCCRGSYANSINCVPTNYSKSFKQVCPASASYALDDRSSIISCSASDYIITFCATSHKAGSSSS